MKSLLSKIYTVLWGDFNGIQVFWSPSTLIYLISSSSILAALTSALSFRIHYMPLFIFLIMLAYIVFVTLKLRLIYGNHNGYFLDEFIGLNISVLGLFLTSLIIYAISAFMLYFYGIDGTLKPVLLLLFKAYTALVILYHYLLSLWLQPFYARNYGKTRAIAALRAWLRRNVFTSIRYTLLILLMVLSSIKIYQLVISLVLAPIQDGVAAYTGINLQLQLRTFYSISDIAVNIGVLIAALLISNIIFYPIVYTVNRLGKYLMPIKTTCRNKNA